MTIPQYGDKRGGSCAAESFEDVAKYANAIGPWKRQIMRDVGAPQLLQTTLIEQAHAAGLRVHTYTFRSEPATLAPEYGNDPQLEYRQFYALGIDGVFSDFPDAALSGARRKLRPCCLATAAAIARPSSTRDRCRRRSAASRPGSARSMRRRSPAARLVVARPI